MKFKSIALTAVAAAALAGCVSTPMGPTVPSSPGPNKSFEAYQQDEVVCEDYARHRVSGEADEANNKAIGSALIGTALGAGLGAAVGGGHGAGVGAASGAVVGTAVGANESGGAQHSIQRQYNIAFAACMKGHGESVQDYGPPPRPAYGPPPPPPGYYPPPPPPPPPGY